MTNISSVTPQRSFYSEADTRAKLIDPALYRRGWSEEHIRREETAGSIEIVEGVPRRQSKGRVDYTLRVRAHKTAQPVAVAYIEAKAEKKPPTEGLEQGKGYAADSKRLNVPFVYATNGHLFVEYDAFTGLTSPVRPMDQFPTPEELQRRYEAGMGFALDSEVARPLLAPYPGGEATRRYYQDAAIRAALEGVAKNKNRVLLSLATGAGKTFIAVNLLKRILDAGLMRKALFVCDRDELRTQALGAFNHVFGADAAEVFLCSDGRNNAHNARIHVATYQTLDTEPKNRDARNFFFKHYAAKNTFSHIIIDECHRSAWGEWKYILDHNPDAIQIGLTATPRELIVSTKEREKYNDAITLDEQYIRDNFKYFGDPVYEYTLAQGIEDGYLAPPEIFTFDLFHEGKKKPEREESVKRADLAGKKLTNSVTGEVVTVSQAKEEYAQVELDERLLMKERVEEMCRHLFARLIEHGGTPNQKTIVFCASDRHADAVATELGSLYQHWCTAHQQEPMASYAFKCTAKSDGSELVKHLRLSSSSHFVACTVELLSTGVDVPCVRNLVFFQYVRSPIVFYQMLGRGTRIDTDTEKLMFRVYDYTDATSLLGKKFVSKFKGGSGGGGGGPPPPPPEPPVMVEGVQIMVAPTGRWLTAMIDGIHSRISVEEYRARVAERLVATAANLDQFRQAWVQPQERRGLINEIVLAGFPPRALQMAEQAENCDLYDVLGEVGYGLNRLTKANRAFAFTYKQKSWLDAMPTDAAATVRAIASQFSRGGTESLETPHIFQTPEVRRAGGLDALLALGEPSAVLMETKERLFAA